MFYNIEKYYFITPINPLIMMWDMYERVDYFLLYSYHFLKNIICHTLISDYFLEKFTRKKSFVNCVTIQYKNSHQFLVLNQITE